MQVQCVVKPVLLNPFQLHSFDLLEICEAYVLSMIHFQFTYFFKHSIWKFSEFCTDFSILLLDTFHDVQDGKTGWILQMVIFCYFFDCVQLELLTSPTSILLRNCLQTKDSIQFCAEERNDFVPTIFLTFCFFLRPMLTESERVE